MTLHFDRLSLRNFGPYKGVQELDLTTPEGAPVVLIHGENTLGKTQLFAALRWCLYGTFQPSQEISEANQLVGARLNKIAAREGDNLLEVSIKFTAEGKSYALTRRATIDGGQGRVSADLRIGASVIPAAQIAAEIGRLLHPQISEFFLFDAELLQRFYDRLNTSRERGFIRESIESVLGVPALQLAQRDVGGLAGEAIERQAKATKNLDQSERFQRSLKKLKSEAAALEKDQDEVAERLRRSEAALQDRRAKLKLVEGLQADVREQEMLEASMAGDATLEASLRADMKSLLSTGWIAVAAAPLAIALQSVQERNSQAQQQEKVISEARTRVSILEDRARGGDCPACGQALPPPDASTEAELSEARSRLEQLLADAGGGTLDLQLERRITGLIDKDSIRRYQEKHRRLNETAMLQYERKRALESISDRLQGNSAADIRALASETSRLEKAVSAAREAISQNEERLKAISSEQQKLARQLSRLPGVEPETALEAGFFSYVETLLDRTIDRYRDRVRGDVESAAHDMFMKLIRDPSGYGRLRISPDYRIDLLDRHDAGRETSEGGKQILALSLIGALKHAAVRGGPVVIDSPLGRLDLEHRANVLQTWVPALGSQAILLVQSGELTKEDAHRHLGSMIGQEYQITRPTNDPELAVIEEAR